MKGDHLLEPLHNFAKIREAKRSFQVLTSNKEFTVKTSAISQLQCFPIPEALLNPSRKKWEHRPCHAICACTCACVRVPMEGRMPNKNVRLPVGCFFGATYMGLHEEQLSTA